MRAALAPCIPCLNKNPRQRYGKQPLAEVREKLIPNDIKSGSLSGVRVRMQSMGHFLNSTKPNSDHSIHLNGDMICVTADLIHSRSQMQQNIESNRLISASPTKPTAEITGVEDHREKENVMMKIVSTVMGAIFNEIICIYICSVSG
jgi:hypothetical protein